MEIGPQKRTIISKANGSWITEYPYTVTLAVLAGIARAAIL